MRRRPGELERRAVDDPAEAAALWRIREDGAGLAARSLDRPAYSGWEDAAVPPERLGAWLRDFDELLREHGLDGVPYGHFGDGCVHVRIDFGFDDGGRRRFREFLVAGATALRAHGGSLSGEHGDGRARSELLPLMYDEESLRLFARGQGDLRPRQPAQPRRARRPGAARRRPAPGPAAAAVATALRLTHDGGSLGEAVHRCTGVGKCVAPRPRRRDVPVVPRHPRREGLHPRPGAGAPGGARRLAGRTAWPTRPCTEALDLCLSCKGCASRLPDRRRHGDVQGGGAAPDVRRPAAAALATTRWAGCRGGPGWPRRWRGC